MAIAVTARASRLWSHTVAGAVFEIIQRDVGQTSAIVRRLPQLSYLSLAPFIGPQEAIRRIRRLMEVEAEH